MLTEASGFNEHFDGTTIGFQVMAIGTQAVFEIANVVAREPIYCVTNYSFAGGQTRSSLGVFRHDRSG